MFEWLWGGNSKWLFLYGATNNSYDLYDSSKKTYEPQKKVIDQGECFGLLSEECYELERSRKAPDLAKDIEAALNYFGVTSMSCGNNSKSPLWPTKEEIAFTFNTEKKDETLGVVCSKTPGQNCKFIKMDKGTPVKAFELYDKATVDLKNGAIGALRSIAQAPELSTEDIDIVCVQTGEQWSRLYPDDSAASKDECATLIKPEKQTDYTDLTKNKLRQTNLLEKFQVKGGNVAAINALAKDYAAKSVMLAESWGHSAGPAKGPAERGAFLTLYNCCQNKKCRAESLQNAGFQMTNDAPAGTEK